MKRTVIALFAFLVAASHVESVQAASAATPAKGASAIAKPGRVTMKSNSSIVTQGAVTYLSAHMTTDTGAVLDADSIRAEFEQGGGTVQTVVATGHVRAFVPQTTANRQYTVYADKGVFDPKTNQIVLTGAVKTVIASTLTDGPLIQTGDAATIQLGKAPDYPIITMTNVETNFRSSSRLG